jgi:hypothetical protein
MKTFLALVLAGVVGSVVGILWEPEQKISKEDENDILADNVLVFQQPLGVGA